MAIPTKVKHGDPIRPGDHNSLVDATRGVYGFRRGTTNRSNELLAKDILSDNRWQYAYAEESIPPHSVFTLASKDTTESNEAQYNRRNPTAIFAKVTEQDKRPKVIVTNDDIAFAEGYKYFCDLISFREPKLVKYDDTEGVPEIGKSLGPKPETYVTSINEEGLVAVSPPDTENKLVWVVRDVPTAATLIEMFEFIEALYPGETAKARKLKWDEINQVYALDPEDTKEYILYDPEEWNVFLPEERVHAVEKTLSDYQGNVFAEYEIIGEHGTRRKATASGSIDCNDTGQLRFQKLPTSVGREHPPPNPPDDANCLMGNSDTFVKACNSNGFNRDIESDELCTVQWDHNRQIFWIEQEDRPVIGEATLSDQMCNSNTGSINVEDARYFDWVRGTACTDEPSPEIDSAVNSKGLEGDSGMKVFITHCHNESDWHVFQVEHSLYSFVRELDVGQDDCGIGITAILQEFAVMVPCKPPIPLDIGIGGTYQKVITGLSIGQGSCELILEQDEVCVLGVRDAAPDSLTFNSVDVVDSLDWEYEEDPNEPDEPGTCKLSWSTKSICTLGDAGPGGAGSLSFMYTDVGYGISEESDCVKLVRKEIPIPECLTRDIEPETIICLLDCEDTEASMMSQMASLMDRMGYTIIPPAKIEEGVKNEVIPEFGTNLVKSGDSIKYDPQNDLTFILNSRSEEGAIIHFENITDSEEPITIKSENAVIESMTARYTASSVQLAAPNLSIYYRLKKTSKGLVWRIV